MNQQFENVWLYRIDTKLYHSSNESDGGVDPSVRNDPDVPRVDIAAAEDDVDTASAAENAGECFDNGVEDDGCCAREIGLLPNIVSVSSIPYREMKTI